MGPAVAPSAASGFTSRAATDCASKIAHKTKRLRFIKMHMSILAIN